MGSSFDALDMLRCAQVNLGNLARMWPELRSHAIFMLVLDQVQTAVDKLEEEQERKDEER